MKLHLLVTTLIKTFSLHLLKKSG